MASTSGDGASASLAPASLAEGLSPRTGAWGQSSTPSFISDSHAVIATPTRRLTRAPVPEHVLKARAFTRLFQSKSRAFGETITFSSKAPFALVGVHLLDCSGTSER